MNKTSIIEMTCEEAKRFFLQSKNYCTLELPKYYDFQQLIERIDDQYSKERYCLIKDKNHYWLNIKELKDSKDRPSNHDDVSYHIIANKDGHYDWRSLQILNPILYVILVNEITREDNWRAITDRFHLFQKDENIRCASLPFSQSEGGISRKGDTIKNWWTEIEQQTIELSMQYKYMLTTDISNCYGSIYTHAIAWALHGKEYSKDNRYKDIIGNRIDALIRWFTYGETCGIPQGSVLMDFIAELVLGYVDYELSNHISENGLADMNYQILRYRDDYKIFANTREDAAKIAKLLTKELEDVNFRLNPSKTNITDQIIHNALKPDKLYWMESKTELPGLQKHLLLIHTLSDRYPNSGSLITALIRFFERITPETFVRDNASTKVLSAILIDIIFHNPKTHPVAIPILGRILDMQGDSSLRQEIIMRLRNKMESVPYTQFMELWLQRLTIKKERDKEYTADLCKAVYDKRIMLWNIEWASQDLRSIINDNSVINENYIEEMNDSPDISEIKIFANRY